MEVLGTRLRAAESRLAQGDPPATVVAGLRAWAGDWHNDQGAWEYDDLEALNV